MPEPFTPAAMPMFVTPSPPPRLRPCPAAQSTPADRGTCRELRVTLKDDGGDGNGTTRFTAFHLWGAARTQPPTAEEQHEAAEWVDPFEP